MSQASYFIEPDQLESLRTNENIVIVDLCKAKQYAQAHIPGAHFINYADIVKMDKPVMGLLPDDENFSAMLSKLGVTKNSLILHSSLTLGHILAVLADNFFTNFVQTLQSLLQHQQLSFKQLRFMNFYHMDLGIKIFNDAKKGSIHEHI